MTVPVCNSRLSAGDFDIWPSVLHAAAVSLVCTVTLATVTAATDSCCLMVKVVLQLLLLSLEGRYYRLMLEAAVPAAAASTAGNATYGADEAAAAATAFEAVLAARGGRFGLLVGRSINFRSVMSYFNYIPFTCFTKNCALQFRMCDSRQSRSRGCIVEIQRCIGFVDTKF